MSEDKCAYEISECAHSMLHFDQYILEGEFETGTEFKTIFVSEDEKEVDEKIKQFEETGKITIYDPSIRESYDVFPFTVLKLKVVGAYRKSLKAVREEEI